MGQARIKDPSSHTLNASLHCGPLGGYTPLQLTGKRSMVTQQDEGECYIELHALTKELYQARKTRACC